MKNKNIVKPKLKDALEIANLIKYGWNCAYKGLIEDDYLKNMDIEKMAEKWKENIKVDKNIYVYKKDRKILGVIRIGESIDMKNVGEIFCLYVRPEEKRKGIGSQLFEFAKDKIIEQGYDEMIVWCLKGNKEGSNFYIKCGGNKIEERDYIIRGLKIREEGYKYNFKK